MVRLRSPLFSSWLRGFHRRAALLRRALERWHSTVAWLAARRGAEQAAVQAARAGAAQRALAGVFHVWFALMPPPPPPFFFFASSSFSLL